MSNKKQSVNNAGRTNELLNAALSYATNGWQIVPLHSTMKGGCTCQKKHDCPKNSQGKHPRTVHGHKDGTSDLNQIHDWWKKWPNANIGLVTGMVSGRVVLDIDVKEGKKGRESLEALLQAHGPLPPTLKSLTTSGGSHYVFRYSQPIFHSPKGARPGIDIQASGCLIVAPPSQIHGKSYQWVNDIEEAECPDWLIDLANNKDLHHHDSTSEIPGIIRALLPNGTEHDGEWVTNCPFPPHEDKHPSFSVRLADGVYNCFACPASGDLVALYMHLKQVSRLEARQALNLVPPLIQELNEKHAVVMVGGHCYIMTEIYDPNLNLPDITFSSPTDLKLRYANRRERRKAIADVWLNHPDRREYEGIVFAPNRVEPGYFNLWQGLAVQPKEGKCDLYLQHIYENIAKKNQEYYTYILQWMAAAVQMPDKRPNVSIVLRGKQGTGKGLMCSEFGKLFGRHFVPVSNSRHFVGNFNAHLKDKVLVFADEAFWAGDKASEGVLKAMVTEDQLAIELKGKDVIFVKNYIHLLVASNHDWVVPAGLEERRFFILDVGDDRMQDQGYFEAIVKQMENGGREALLDFLLHYNLTGVNLRKFPQTEALLEHKLLSMGTVEQFWYERLVAGTLELGNAYWERQVVRAKLHEQYIEHVKSLGQGRKSCETELGRNLNKLVPGLQKVSRTEPGSGQKHLWIFPSLQRCRDAFDKATNYQHPWPKMEEDDTESELGEAVGL